MADAAPETSHRPRMLARPRTFGRPILWSIGVHTLLAVLVILLWELVLKPPPRPIRITAERNAPSRESLGLDASGHPTWADAAASPTPARD